MNLMPTSLVSAAILAALMCSVASRASVSIEYPHSDAPVVFALNDLRDSLAVIGETVVSPGSGSTDRDAWRIKIDVETQVAREGFRITTGDRLVTVQAGDSTGAMYGMLDLAEQLRVRQNLGAIREKAEQPRFEFRAIKFNLPWSPYREGRTMEIHTSVCRDVGFWQAYLDMMARNRFSVLTLWNRHPFPYLIRPTNFPEASPFSDTEMTEWRRFWTTLFRMAKERGIDTYVVNWNIVVSPEFAKAHGVNELNDKSDIVRRYTKECVTQLIDEYDDLTGVGVTLADWMKEMTPKEREDWIDATFVEGMKAAKRPCKFIHRSVLAGDPMEMRRVIDKTESSKPVWVEIKFNWSHGHSTPRLSITHDYNSGEIDERFWNPAPTNYKIAWMIRNEDFFILRWGEPGFIRDHIARNGKEYAGGYFIGSEGYIPAMEFAARPGSSVTWHYAFERQWLFYMMWGRLLYDPETPDDVFAQEFDRRYGSGVGAALVRAYRLASRMPLRLASFHAATWDFTLYSEGFHAPRKSRGLFDGHSPFISIDELIEHETLDPTYVNIPDFVESKLGGETIADSMITPLELADASEKDAGMALAALEDLKNQVTPYSGALLHEIGDVKAWGYLGVYFADKLRAGVALQTFRQTGHAAQKQQAIALLERCVGHWENVVAVTRGRYRATPHPAWRLDRKRKPTASHHDLFAWEFYRDDVKRDVELAKTAEAQDD